MFGYVTPFKPDLKVREFEVYKAIYCGLCKELGRAYGPFARLTLSYDFAFLAIFKLSVDQTMPQFKNCRCAVNPLRKKSCACACEPIHFCAACAMIMLYYKVIDNIRDSGFFRSLLWRILLPAAKRARKKAADEYPTIDQAVAECMQKQESLESSKISSIDLAADPTANALSRICSAMTDDPEKQRHLSRFGYLLGRWIYLIDALDDLEKDLKSDGYNPFAISYGLQSNECNRIAEVRQQAVASLNMTVAELQLAFEALELKHLRPILANVAYLGLLQTQQRIISQTDKESESVIR